MRVVQVYAPRCRDGGIVVARTLYKVLFAQHHVAQQAARLAFAAYVCHPCQTPPRKLFALRTAVLQVCPVAVYGQQGVVADMLDIVDLILVKDRLPVPVAACDGNCRAFVELQRPRTLWKRTYRVHLFGVPLYRCAHNQRVGLVGGARFAALGAALAPRAEVGPREEPNGGITRAVGKQFPFES